MPEKAILRKPDAGPQVNGNVPGNDDALTKFVLSLTGGLTGGLMGEEQRPGDLPSALGAAAVFLPLTKLLKTLKGGQLVNEITPAANVGDQLLREHVYGSPRMREFLPVGEEGAAMAESAGAKGNDALETAYRRIMEGHIKSPMKPGEHPPTAPKQGVDWPREKDLEELKARLRKPLNGQ